MRDEVFDATIELAHRYKAMGMGGAARSALYDLVGAVDTYAERQMESLPFAYASLIDWCLDDGASSEALDLAEALAKVHRGPYAHWLKARAHYAERNFDAARMSFLRAIEASGRMPTLLAQNYIGMSLVAAAQNDPSAAGSHAAEALRVLVFRADMDDDAIFLIDTVLERCLLFEREEDASELLDADSVSDAAKAVLYALLLEKWQARGKRVADTVFDEAVTKALGERPESLLLQRKLIESVLRRRFRDPKARERALAQLDATLQRAGGAPGASVALADLYMLEALAYEGTPGDHAEKAYRAALRARPGYVSAANSLALLALARNDSEQAVGLVEHALRANPDNHFSWHAAARVLASAQNSDMHSELVAGFVEAANPGVARFIGDSVRKLAFAMNDISRDAVMAGLHTRGHRLKNSLGIIGARVRSLGKRTQAGSPDRDTLTRLEADVMELYEDWSSYLRVMAATPTIDILQPAALIYEVVTAARQRADTPVATSLAGTLPDIRGDKFLLREALMNITLNAVEACDAHGRGEVEVIAAARNEAGVALLTIEVKDTGPGIEDGDLARLFKHGFTTKATGSGVGLAVAQRVISAHYGQISVASQLGRGTCVTVTLPSDLAGFSGLAFPNPQAELES